MPCFNALRVLLIIMVALGGMCRLASAQTYQLSNAVVYGNLAVFPVRGGDGGAGVAPLTLEQALANGAIRFRRETSHQLVIENLSDAAVFVQLGTLLKGGTQDQVAAESLLVGPRDRATLPVFCVDPFRSTARSGEDPTRFTVSTNLLPSRMARLALLSGLSTANINADQELRQLAIWWSIDSLDWALSRKLGNAWMPASMATEQQQSPAVQRNVDHVLQARRSYAIPSLPLTLEHSRLADAIEPYVDFAESALTTNRDITGAVFAINGRLVAAELYQSNGLFREMMPKLLRAYAIEAISHDGGTQELPTTTEVGHFLEAAHHGPSHRTASIGNFHVGGGNATAYGELLGPDGWIHRSYVNKLGSDADMLAPEATVLDLLKAGQIDGRPIGDLTLQDRVIVKNDSTSGRWVATIQPTTRKISAMSMALTLIVLNAIAYAIDYLVLIWWRSPLGRARLQAAKGRAVAWFGAIRRRAAKAQCLKKTTLPQTTTCPALVRSNDYTSQITRLLPASPRPRPAYRPRQRLAEPA